MGKVEKWTCQVEIANFPALKISSGNREIAPYFPRDAGREAGNEAIKKGIFKELLFSNFRLFWQHLSPVVSLPHGDS